MSDEQTPDATADEATADTATTPDQRAEHGDAAVGPVNKRGRRRGRKAGADAIAADEASADRPGESLPGDDAETAAAPPASDDSLAVALDVLDATETSASPDAAGGPLVLDEPTESELFDPSEVADAPRAPHPLKPVVEALIFASPEPLTVKAMTRVLEDQTREDIETALAEVRDTYQRSDGLQLVEVAGGYQIVTRPELYEWVRRLFKERTTSKLSVQALETLAVIAYKQPVTSGEIAEIRGVSATTGVLNTLLDRKLVKIVGRKQVVGRPFMYGTTREFLDKFGLRDLSDLPKVEDMSEALGFDLPSPVDEGDGVSLPFDGPIEASLFGGGEPAAAVQAADDDGVEGTGTAPVSAGSLDERDADTSNGGDEPDRSEDVSDNPDASDEDR